MYGLMLCAYGIVFLISVYMMFHACITGKDKYMVYGGVLMAAEFFASIVILLAG